MAPIVRALVFLWILSPALFLAACMVDDVGVYSTKVFVPENPHVLGVMIYNVVGIGLGLVLVAYNFIRGQ